MRDFFQNKIIFLITGLFIISIFASGVKAADVHAFRAREIPIIDGQISKGEWDDSINYFWSGNSTLSWSVAGAYLYTNLSLKYDDSWIYILFTINDNESDIGDYLFVGGGYNASFSIEGDDGILLLENGHIYHGLIALSGIAMIDEPVNASGACTYSNKTYVFEMKIDRSYFNIENNSCDFFVEYHDDSSRVLLGSMPQIYFHLEMEILDRFFINLIPNLQFRNLTLEWKNLNNSCVQKYSILSSTNPSFPKNNTTVIEISDKNATSYEFTNLSNGKYYFKLLVYNSTGVCAESNMVEATVNLQAPSPPSNLNAILSDSKVNLKWNPSSNDGNATITEYRIYRGTSPDSLELIASVNGSATGYIDSNVSKGETYYYSVSAVNPIGESNLSGVVSIEIPEENPQPTPSLDFVWVIGAIAFIMIMKHRRKRKNEL